MFLVTFSWPFVGEAVPLRLNGKQRKQIAKIIIKCGRKNPSLGTDDGCDADRFPWCNNLTTTSIWVSFSFIHSGKRRDGQFLEFSPFSTPFPALLRVIHSRLRPDVFLPQHCHDYPLFQTFRSKKTRNISRTLPNVGKYWPTSIPTGYEVNILP